MKAQLGDTVKVHYAGKFDDNTIFDSSFEAEPIQFTLGEGEVIPGFEEAVVGMDIGEHKDVEVPPERAYGPHLDELVAQVSKDQLPSGLRPEVGKMVQVSNQTGAQFIMTITNIEGGRVTLDANHPLAGRELYFEIELLEILS